MKKYGKNLLLISRIVLLCVGFALGFVAMLGILGAYKGYVATAYRYAYCIFTGLFLGIVLMLSCRSVLWLLFTIGEGIKNLCRGKKPADAAGVLIGIALGGMLTYLFDFLISLVISALSLRVILDVVFALAAVGLGMFAAIKALRVQGKRDSLGNESEQNADFAGGYLLTSSALACEGIARFCKLWLICPVAVLDVSVARLNALGNDASQALDAYSELLESGCAFTVSVGTGSEREQAEKYALENGLRIIAASCGEFADCKAPVLGFCELSSSCKS